MKERYIKVEWPEVQDFMEEEGWEKCIFCMDTRNHPCPDCTYMVPEEIYNRIKNEKRKKMLDIK